MEDAFYRLDEERRKSVLKSLIADMIESPYQTEETLQAAHDILVSKTWMYDKRERVSHVPCWSFVASEWYLRPSLRSLDGLVLVANRIGKDFVVRFYVDEKNSVLFTVPMSGVSDFERKWVDERVPSEDGRYRCEPENRKYLRLMNNT